MEVAKLILLNARSKKVITDKVLWYKSVSKELGIKQEYETFEKRNVVERALYVDKEKDEELFKRFPVIADMKQ